MLTGLDNIHVLADLEGLARAVAERVIELARHNIEATGRFSIALAGGGTPRHLYTLLASAEFRGLTDWNRWQVFFGDERCVAPDHADSNYRMARETLLDHVPIPAEQIHPMVYDPSAPQEAAAAYEARLYRHVDRENDMPVLDLVLLGLGHDGHTASLFPETDILDVRDRLVAAVHVEKLQSWRISMTYPLLDHARHICFMVAGENKQRVIRDLHDGRRDPLYPVERLSPQGTVEWFLDELAMGDLR